MMMVHEWLGVPGSGHSSQLRHHMLRLGADGKLLHPGSLRFLSYFLFMLFICGEDVFEVNSSHRIPDKG